jgi:hypothetical protein
MTTQLQIEWEKETLTKFNTMIEKIPLFHRNIAREVAKKRAQLNAQERNSPIIEESDVVRAFFSEVPMAFYSLMVRLLDEVGFDYKPYEPK